MTTPNLVLDELVASQSQPHVPINTSLRRLDAAVQLSVISASETAPPSSPAPQDGDRYIVAATATGLWAGHEDEIAFYRDNAWQFVAPKDGWLAWVVDAQEYQTYNSAGSPPGWATFAAGGGGGGTAADVQIFTAAGTWTKPTDAKWVDVLLIGGGGGGGSGRRGASGSDRYGGGGGGSGGLTRMVLHADTLGATESVTVTGTGAGGAARTTNDTNGASGSTGKTISFGDHLKANGGLGGGGGSSTFGNGGGPGTGLLSNGADGGDSSAPGYGSSGSPDKISPGYGGAGSGIDTTNDFSQWGMTGGGPGGSCTGNGNSISGGTGGNLSAGGAGGSDTYSLGGGGGGGAAGQAASAGYAGGAGGDYGGGGGGGGASVNGFNSGAGGAGGGCLCIVTTTF